MEGLGRQGDWRAGEKCAPALEAPLTGAEGPCTLPHSLQGSPHARLPGVQQSQEHWQWQWQRQRQ